MNAYVVEVISFVKCRALVALYAFPFSPKPLICPAISSSLIDRSIIFEW
jgi:hypothetical protein